MILTNEARRASYEAIVANRLAEVREAITEFRADRSKGVRSLDVYALITKACKDYLTRISRAKAWLEHTEEIDTLLTGGRPRRVRPKASAEAEAHLWKSEGVSGVRRITRELTESVETAYAESYGETSLKWWLSEIIVDKVAR